MYLVYLATTVHVPSGIESTIIASNSDYAEFVFVPTNISRNTPDDTPRHSWLSHTNAATLAARWKLARETISLPLFHKSGRIIASTALTFAAR